MQPSPELYFRNSEEWRNWLAKNHGSEKEVWIIYYKKNTGKVTISHPEAVEEALCFGWIDSKVISIDDKRYKQKFTPRNPNSVWSKINKDAVTKLIKEKKMTKYGLEKINAAKKAGTWKEAYTSKILLPLPEDLKDALSKNQVALNNFNKFAATYRNMYIGWVTGTKQKETREKRIKEVVENSLKNKRASYL